MEPPHSSESWDVSATEPSLPPAAPNDPPHPYLRRVYHPTDPALQAELLAISQLPPVLQTARAFLATYCSPPSLRFFLLRRLPVIQGVPISDRLLTENNPGGGFLPEYPELFIVVDEPESFLVEEMEKYLSGQSRVGLAFVWLDVKGVTPVCAIVSSENLTVVFDATRLSLTRLLLFLRQLLQNPEVVKVVNGWPAQLRGLEHFYTVRPRNVHDVSVVEAAWDGGQRRGMYSMTAFQARYRNGSRWFQRGGEQFFAAPLQLQVPGKRGIAEWSEAQFEALLKQVIFLQLVRKLQIQRSLTRAIRCMEIALRDVYKSREWEVDTAKDDWQDDPESNTVHVSKNDTAALPAIFLNKDAAESSSSERDAATDDDDADEPESESEFYY
ncbi:uncharacterized protein LOC129598081 isoform X2 [Paramacrobiotus metropolitanus]|nr:uncharacterized protein LOC129598081 isoform X2 [Paramacrobiotus metropolitanus]XP_055351804.1 uncharacterized protein LOC129598081 isoform X2 [Paramacrobiotus metropolitanus]